MLWLLLLMLQAPEELDRFDPANDKERFVSECMMCHGSGDKDTAEYWELYLKANWYKGHGRMTQDTAEGRFPLSGQMGKNQFLKYQGCKYEPTKMELNYPTDGGADWECAFWGFVEESNWHASQPGLTMGRHDLANLEDITRFRRPDVSGPSGPEHRSHAGGPWQVKIAHNGQDLLVIYTTDDVYYNLDIRGLAQGAWVMVPDNKEPKYVSYCKCKPNEMEGADWPGITDAQ